MIPGSPRIAALDRRGVAGYLRTELGITRDATPEGLTYELIRAVAWASTGGRAPVSTRVLLDRLIEPAMAIVDRKGGTDSQRSELRRAMSTLAAVGDLVELGRGQWLSASGCIVSLEGTPAPSYLLVSGIPLREFDADAKAAVAVDDARRTIRDAASVGRFDLPTVSYTDWVRAPRIPLREWTESALAAPLRRFTDEGENASAMEVYAPHRASLNQRQNLRWVPLDMTSDGRALVRYTVFGEPMYAIVNAVQGSVTGIRECVPQDVRRLMYGLDQKYENPTVVTAVDGDGKVSFRLENAVPYAEARALLVLVENSADEGRLVTRHGGTVRGLLRRLGIDVKNGRGAEFE